MDCFKTIGKNQDSSCIFYGTQNGFHIFKTDPFEQILQHKSKQCIKHMAMLGKSNIIALVGDEINDKKDRLQPNKVTIWDENIKAYIGDLFFCESVKAVQLKLNFVIVVLEYKIKIYNLQSLKQIETVETVSNPYGLCEISFHSSDLMFACLSSQAKNAIDIYTFCFFGRKNVHIKAHKTNIILIAMCDDASKIATASETGTIIRVFDVAKGTKLHELRRGINIVTISCLQFDVKSHWVVCSSNKGTIHLFDISSSSSSSKSFLSSFLPFWLQQESSFAHYYIEDEIPCMIVFGKKKDSLLVICANVNSYNLSFFKFLI